jgi:hypothetical protein
MEFGETLDQMHAIEVSLASYIRQLQNSIRDSNLDVCGEITRKMSALHKEIGMLRKHLVTCDTLQGAKDAEEMRMMDPSSQRRTHEMRRRNRAVAELQEQRQRQLGFRQLEEERRSHALQRQALEKEVAALHRVCTQMSRSQSLRRHIQREEKRDSSDSPEEHRRYHRSPPRTAPSSYRYLLQTVLPPPPPVPPPTLAACAAAATRRADQQ